MAGGGGFGGGGGGGDSASTTRVKPPDWAVLIEPRDTGSLSVVWAGAGKPPSWPVLVEPWETGSLSVVWAASTTMVKPPDWAVLIEPRDTGSLTVVWAGEGSLSLAVHQYFFANWFGFGGGGESASTTMVKPPNWAALDGPQDTGSLFFIITAD